jgi:hypothetical protein
VHVLDALQPPVNARQRARVDEPLPQGLVQDFTDERALAGSGRAGHRDQFSERNRQDRGENRAVRLDLPDEIVERALECLLDRALVHAAILQFELVNCGVGEFDTS